MPTFRLRCFRDHLFNEALNGCFRESYTARSKTNFLKTRRDILFKLGFAYRDAPADLRFA
jgi:hypothetical protein